MFACTHTCTNSRGVAYVYSETPPIKDTLKGQISLQRTVYCQSLKKTTSLYTMAGPQIQRFDGIMHTNLACVVFVVVLEGCGLIDPDPERGGVS